MKRRISLLLAVLLVVSLTPAAAWTPSASAETVQPLDWLSSWWGSLTASLSLKSRAGVDPNGSPSDSEIEESRMGSDPDGVPSDSGSSDSRAGSDPNGTPVTGG